MRLRGLVHQVQGCQQHFYRQLGNCHGNHDLSQRTEQTAANLESRLVHGGADRHRPAKRPVFTPGQRLCIVCRTVAARGGAVVSQVVTTMDQITASSRKIADITGVIDDCLPDQHPGAERGRGSGPRGRAGPRLCRGGSEVRSLAQRSAKRPRNQGLIGSSGRNALKWLAPGEPGGGDHDRS
jgi:methyl-accepting chemotaxis protein